MSENPINQAFDEQSKKLNLVLQFTNGDQGKAMAMLNGQYNDIRIVKGRFSIRSADLFASFLLFLKTDNSTVSNITIQIFNDDTVYQKVRINDTWELFYKNTREISNLTSVIETADIADHIVSSAEGFDLFSPADADDCSAIQSTMTEILKKFYNLPDIECFVEVDSSNSLKLSEKNIPIIAIEKAKKAIRQQLPEKKSELESKYSLIMNAKVIVSPVKGKYINDLAEGDIIRCLPLRNDVLSMKIAAAQKALTPENEIKPLRAKFKERLQLDEGGCILYCLIANNVLAKIIEEENVKIDLYNPNPDSAAAFESSRLFVYVVLLIGLIVLAIGILYIML